MSDRDPHDRDDTTSTMGDESTRDTTTRDTTANDATTRDTTANDATTRDTTAGDPATTDRRRNPGERGKWISMLIALIGLWLLAEAVVFDLADVNFWNDVIIGVGLIALGGYNYYRRSEEQFGSVSVGAFVALLGLWLLAAPFVMDTGATAGMDTVPFWNDVVVGLLALVLGAYSAYEARRDSRTAAPTRT